eukprot:SAG31_NODE_23707_length_498_cov_0.819549_1_plen_153_part_10
MTAAKDAERQQEALAAETAMRAAEKIRLERAAKEQQRLVVENFERSERSKARLTEKKQADLQALKYFELDFLKRLEEREEEIASRLRARAEKLDVKRETTAKQDAERRARQEALEYARTHDASAGLSKTEQKQEKVAQAARRKQMQEALRAEA